MIACVARPCRTLEDGDAERGGLAGAGAGLPRISTPVSARDQQGLNLGRRGELQLGQRPENGRPHAQRGESLGNGGMFGLIAQCASLEYLETVGGLYGTGVSASRAAVSPGDKRG